MVSVPQLVKSCLSGSYPAELRLPVKRQVIRRLRKPCENDTTPPRHYSPAHGRLIARYPCVEARSTDSGYCVIESDCETIHMDQPKTAVFINTSTRVDLKLYAAAGYK